MSKEITIKTNAICKEFDKKQILNRINLAVGKGEILAILGENGAGKTTLLKLIAGLLEPTEGEAMILEKNVWNFRLEILSQIGLLIETPFFYEHLSAKENLKIHLAYMNSQGDIDLILNQVGLSKVGEKPVSKFSLGMRQRLAIARSIIHKPKILLLDEPINGLDPIAIKEIRELLLFLKADGITILLSSHILSEVVSTADRIAVIKNGNIVEIFEVDEAKGTYGEKLEDYVISIMQVGKII